MDNQWMRAPNSPLPPKQSAAKIAKKTSPVSRERPAASSASDTVFFGVVNGLEQQTFVPGQRLAEVDLTVQFGVGRNSVREALQRLAAEGFVELHRHKGAVIRALSLQDTLDVLDVAERMTGLLASAAARRAKESPWASALNDALRGCVAAAAAGDAIEFASARRGFYRALLEMGGNNELKRLFPAIQMPIVHAQHRLPDLMSLRVSDYRKIAEAALAGNEIAADAAGIAHVRRIRDGVLRRA